MTKFKGELQTDNGDVLYPHTNSDVVFNPNNGMSIKEEINHLVDGTIAVGKAKGIEPQLISNLNTHDIDGFFFYNSNAIGAITVTPGILKHEKFDINFAYQTCMPYDIVGHQYIRAKIYGIWKEWEKIATDKQEDWITATLQNGWTGTLQYRKNQIGQIELFGLDIKHSNPSSVTNLVATTLPTGYRQSGFINLAAFNLDTLRTVLPFCIENNGNIRFRDVTGISADNRLHINVVFVV